jgi:hypothetical protein
MAAYKGKMPESLYIAMSLVDTCFIKGVEDYVYDQYINSKKSKFAALSSILISFSSVDVNLSSHLFNYSKNSCIETRLRILLILMMSAMIGRRMKSL